jgi:hypothetical protein
MVLVLVVLVQFKWRCEIKIKSLRKPEKIFVDVP